MTNLSVFVNDFAACIQSVDAQSPQATNIRSKLSFKPGIGPFSEAQTVKLVSKEMERFNPSRYSKRLQTGVAYPETPRQKCDLCLGIPDQWEIAFEVKMLRFLGDNGKLNDNILMHILSPYPEHRSAITDCIKLASSSLGESKAILIYGFDHEGWPLEPAIDAFETLASVRVQLGPRNTTRFENLIHPVHTRGAVFAWQIRRQNNG